MHKKQIYLAAPFFNPTQLATVEMVENLIEKCGIACYSPRKDGVLKAMTAEERKAAAPKIFKLNCSNIVHSDGFLALLDEHDTGTYWECGFAYYNQRYVTARYKTFAFTSGSKVLNVMLRQGFQHYAQSIEELEVMLTLWRDNKAIAGNAASADVY